MSKPAAASGAGPIYDKEGVLIKLGQQIKSWKSRVFALSKIKKTIYYFENDEVFAKHKKDKVRNFKGTINLQNASLYIADYMDAEICFELSTPSRNYFIVCKTKSELADWVSEIASCGVRIKCPFRNAAPEYPSVFAKHGFMDKRGLWVTGFKTRFFRTVENAGGKMVLAYYQTVEDMEPKGIINLTGITVTDLPGTDEFKIKVPGQEREWHMRCKPKDETDRPDKAAKLPGANPYAKADEKAGGGGGKNRTDKQVWMDVLNAITRGDYEWNPPEQVAAAAAANAALGGGSAAGAGVEGAPAPASSSAIAYRELYDVLGVAVTATPEEIVKAYKAKAKLLHPDALQNRNDPQAKEKFQHLLSAYHALMDKETRAKYDAEGDSQAVGVQPSPVPVVAAGAAAAAAAVAASSSAEGKAAPASNGVAGGAAAAAPAAAVSVTALTPEQEREERMRRENESAAAAARELGRPETPEEKDARLKKEKAEEARRAKLAMYGTSKNPKQTLVDIIHSTKEEEAAKEMRARDKERAEKEREQREAAYRAEQARLAAGGAPAGQPLHASPAPPLDTNTAAATVTHSAGPVPASPSPSIASAAPSPMPAGVVPATPTATSQPGADGTPAAAAPASAAAVAAATTTTASPAVDAKAEALAKDRAYLTAGVEMIKIPKWGDHVKRKYYLVEVKRAGEKGKPDTTEWAIKWQSKGKKPDETTFYLTGCTLFKGHQKGYFKDKSNQKLYAAAASFSLFSKQREMDLYCCSGSADDAARWYNVLAPLVVAVVEAPTGPTNSTTHNASKK